MGGTELVYNLFSECKPSGGTHSGLCIIDPGSFEQAWLVARAILVAMVVKGALTVVTFGIKVPAGIFIPTLGVGACAGRVLGITVQFLQMQYPSSPLFRKCHGGNDCEHFKANLISSRCILLLFVRYHPRTVRYGRCCSHTFWCYRASSKKP